MRSNDDQPDRTAAPETRLGDFGFDDPDDRWLTALREAETAPELGMLGRFELREEVSRGGQGIIYRAEDPVKDRQVAIKRLVAGTFATPSMRHRFEREVEAAANLNHPNIVTVYGTERIDGQTVLIMEWLDALPITEWRLADGGTPTIDRKLELFIRVCDAVQHAHQRGVIHRDLKPSNILVNAAGMPTVLDFGIAKLDRTPLESWASVTASGQFMGTPAYASPELVRGGAHEVDVRSDVYALGIVLYELLCDRMPYAVDGSLADIFDSIERTEPTRPMRVQPAIDRELEAIMLMALRKDPGQRYQSVEAFGADLARYGCGEAVEARGTNRWYIARKAVRRHRVPVTIGLVLLALVCGYAVLMPYLFWRAEREATNARDVQAFLQETLATASPFRLGGDLKVSTLLDRAADRIDEDPDLRPVVEAALHATIAQAYGNLWRWRKAEAEARKAADLYAELTDTEQEHAASLNLLGRALAFQQKPESIEVLQSALRIRRAVHGPQDRLVAETLASLGFAFWHAQTEPRWMAAMQAYREAAAMHERTQTEPDQLWARTLFSYAMCLLNRRRYDEAEPLFRRSIDMYRGLEHEGFYTIRCLWGYGRLLHERRQFDEAEAVMLEALSLYPPGFADECTVMMNWSIGGMHYQRGDHPNARRRQHEALASVCEMLIERFPGERADLSAIAGTLRDDQRAKSSYDDFIEILNRLDPEFADDWRTVIAGMRGGNIGTIAPALPYRP